MTRFTLVCLALLLCLLLPRSVHAQRPAALCLTVSGAAAPDGAEALRAAIARELGVAVELRARCEGQHIAVLAQPDAGGLQVSVHAPARAPVQRTLAAGLEDEASIDTAALLAVNLLRDEAAELLATLAPPAKPRAPRPDGCAPARVRRVWVGADLVPYVGTSQVHGADVERTFSFNLLGGIAGSVRGFELGGGLNLLTRGLCGVQLSAAINVVTGPVHGAQIALVNTAAQHLHGLQLGLIDIAAGTSAGAQVGLVNVGSDRFDGLQLGHVNVAGPVDGAQVGLVNVSAGGASGFQLGQVNVSTGETRGAQVGLANVADRPVQGVMVGLLNVAPDADAAIGLVNVLWRGRTHLDVWGTDAGLVMVGLEHGGKVVHNIYGVGVSHRDRLGAMFTGALGVGVRVVDAPSLTLDIDAIQYSLLGKNELTDRHVWGSIEQLRIAFGWRIVKGFALVAAPAVNVSVAKAADPFDDLSLYGSTRLSRATSDTQVRIWPGLSLGLRFF